MHQVNCVVTTMKTLLFLLGCVAFSNALRYAYVSPSVRPGACPPPSDLAGICVFNPDVNCLRDSQCAFGEKCCSEGCGKVCKVALPANMPIHAGSCPAPTNRLGPCVLLPNSCSSDDQCSREEKCCPEGCNRICKTAIHRGK